MKKQYFEPEIKVEILTKADVLLLSEQTDNTFVHSKEIIKSNFMVEDIL